MDLTELRPVVAEEALAEVFQVKPGTPLLFMDERNYDIEGRPAFCAKIYYIDGVIKRSVMRKKF